MTEVVQIDFINYETINYELVPIKMRLVGYLLKETRNSYYISSWLAYGSANKNHTKVHVINKDGAKLKRIKVGN